MKYLYIPAIATLITIFYSCDYVKLPYPPKIPCDNDTVACPLPVFPTRVAIKKVLLEDYTGHHCTNCPNAGREAVKLDSIFGEKLVVMSVHAGGFARTYPIYSIIYSYDFRTTAGDKYNSFFGIAAYPNGMINRIGFPANNHKKGYTSWSSGIQAVINNAPDADIQIINNYDNTTRKLCVHVQSKFLKQMTGTYQLVVVLTEDSIIKPQLDNGVDVLNYVHRHALRATISCGGEWGDALAKGSVANGNTYTKSYLYNMPADFNGLAPDITHCAVIAYIYDDDPVSPTYKQVIQAEEKKID